MRQREEWERGECFLNLQLQFTLDLNRMQDFDLDPTPHACEEARAGDV